MAGKEAEKVWQALQKLSDKEQVALFMYLELYHPDVVMGELWDKFAEKYRYTSIDEQPEILDPFDQEIHADRMRETSRREACEKSVLEFNHKKGLRWLTLSWAPIMTPQELEARLENRGVALVPKETVKK